ncbi:MAG: phage holin family protein [Clostridia bacterium]|nr:phage holin family protein [Clostridia bacterium]
MVFNEFINTYGATILYSVLTAIAGYIGIALKNLYTKYVNDKTKKDVVRTCVKAVEQIYTDLHGEDKLNKCIESVSAMLCAKGITITDIEIRMLIEAAVNEFNQSFSDIDYVTTLDYTDDEADAN